MNILLLGSGGREHAIAYKIAQSKLCDSLFIAPGNPGTAQFGKNVSIDLNDFSAIEELVNEHQIEMLIVGPEEPLVNGIYDYFETKKVLVIGPSKMGAQLEGSKTFSKYFMQRNNIPTAAFKEFTKENLADSDEFIDVQNAPIVLKADGLAGGKGVLILENKEDAKKALQSMILEEKFGKASQKVVVEQFLKGIEFSVFILTDGKNYLLLPNAKDYKRIGEGDTGLNTGGMGCISPVPFVTDKLMQKVTEKVIKPTLEGLQKEEIKYFGFIYFGFMLVENEPYVIEYNCRMGDPETEIVFPRITSDMVAHFIAVGNGKLNEEKIEIDPRKMATVIVASGGYPENFEKGKEIIGLKPSYQNSFVFQAGTKVEADKLVTNGGRVLAVSSYGETLSEAVKCSNQIIDEIHFDGKYFRKDIGWEFA